MAIGKVTISSIAKLDGWLWDTHVTGFGARRQTNGTFYYVRYRHNGTQTVKSIGRHGPLTPDTARAKAKQLLGTVAGGTDPFAQALSGEGFPAAIDRYLERKRTSLKPNSFRETVRYLRDHSLPLHSLRLAQIDRRKVAALLGGIETGSGAATRNRARSALSAFFSWCIQEGLIDTNPVTGTGKANEGGSRERVLTRDELCKEEPPALPEGIMALELLQLAYRGKIKLTPQQARCAIESLPYETPKLSATAIATMDGKSFAETIDRAIERSKLPPMLNAPTIELVDATELKKPMSRYRRF